ncbi:MAG: hypothetical protein WBA77_18100 [Microcoleaceae cyanobacterium]
MIPANSLTKIHFGGELESRAGLPLSNGQLFKILTTQRLGRGGTAGLQMAGLLCRWLELS